MTQKSKYFNGSAVRILVYARAMDASHRQSLLSTLAYYHALGWPLTAVEVFRHRVTVGSGRDVSLADCVAGLDSLVLSGEISTEGGLYWWGRFDRDGMQRRIEREALNADVWPRVVRATSWMQMVPFVRMIAASGSLAMGSTTQHSDWDVFVVAEHRRLYTTRAGVLLVAWLQGRLRTKGMRRAPQRFCCNHFVTTESLSIRHRSLFVAHVLSWMIPIYDPMGYGPRFRDANRWTDRFVAHSLTTETIRRTVRSSRLLSLIRRVSELVLTTFIGDAVESTLRWWMQRRITGDPRTYERGGRIVASDTELEFHPRSFERVALSRYNESLRVLGYGALMQHDSGLR